MGTLITFSGVDCAGKSTQLELLEARLRAEGHRVRTLWFRPGYSKELDGLRAAVRRVRPGALPRSDGADSQRRDEVFQKPTIRRSWVAMALADSLVQYAFKLRTWIARGDVVLCDRYLWDSEMDLRLRFPELKEPVRRAMKGLDVLCPKPDLALLLVLSMEAASQRMAQKDEPFPDPEETRHDRYHRYMSLASSGKFAVIDAEGSRDDVAELIWRQVCASLK